MDVIDFEPLKFEESFVVFLDVLGFTELVFSDNEEELQKINFSFWIVEKYLKQLKDELDEINKEVKELNPEQTKLFKLDYILISDSIIITIKQIKYDFSDMNKDKFNSLDKYFSDTTKRKKIKPIKEKQEKLYLAIKELIGLYNTHNKQGFEKLCEAIVKIQKTLGSENIWLRGAISADTTHISTNKKQIIGKAYIKALKLEEKAKYPRVILDKKSIFNALNFKDEDDFIKEIPYIFNWNTNSFKKSFPLFLDYIYYTAVVFSDENRDELDKIIQNALISYEDSKLEVYHDKFIWLLEYISNCLERGDESYNDLLNKVNVINLKK